MCLKSRGASTPDYMVFEFCLEIENVFKVELVSKELNHFGVIADLFRQIGGHSSRFVLFCSFEDFSLKK